jgi:O-antigen/teichoic acid export membrane protein
MSVRRLVLQNSLLNFATSVSQRLGQTVIFILVARLLSPESLGAFKLSITYSSILLTICLWGLDQLLIREVAKDRHKAGYYLGGFLSLRLFLAILFWLLLAVILPFLPYTADSRQLILLMTLAIIPGSVSNLYQSVWVALENIKGISAIILFFSLIRLAIGSWLLWIGHPLIQIAYLFVLVSLGEMLANMWLTHRQGVVPDFHWRFDLAFWAEQLKIATPLIIVSFVLIVEYQFDDVILSLFWPEGEVGIYGTAATLLSLLLFLTRSFQLAIFPVISRAFHNDLAYLRKIYVQATRVLLLGAFPIALLVTLFSNEIIGLIFGPGYDEAGPMLSVLVWAFFISGLNVPNSRLMIVADRQNVMAKFAMLSMIGNVTLSLLLVPQWGGQGTAWARVLAMPLYTLPTLWYVHRHICPTTWRNWIGRL